MIKLNETEKKIANAIVYAQISSDAGKERYDLEGMDAGKTMAAKILGYESKTALIERAINLIRSSKNTIFSYYLIYEKDQNGAPSYITYFEFDDEEDKNLVHQISFHIPRGEASEYIRSLEGSGRPTEWNGIKGGSVATCKLLLQILKENEENDETAII